jgi:hypothetical protein
MTLRVKPLAAALAALPLGACSSAPAYSHSWCAPLITQFHATESRQAYLSRLAALQRQGAPVAGLIRDETAYTRDVAAANVPGTAGFGALASAPAALGKVSADLKVLNAACGQPADAWKGDNA